MKTVWANTIVKNEERYLWFAVNSVIKYVDKILIWDTGSSDNTVKIIELLKQKYPEKIEFKEYGIVDPEKFTNARNAMLEQTSSDWVMILDGDEVWWEESINKILKIIQAEDLETIVTPYYNVIGDIYHYQEDEAGMYRIDDKKGHYNIRFLNKNIPGLHLEKPHGQQGFFDRSGVLIQNRSLEKRKFVDEKYMHFTNMQRSSSKDSDILVPRREGKFKYEIGKKFPKDFHFPEVFYETYPSIVPDPWQTMSKGYFLRSSIQTLAKKIKRRILPSRKVGY